MNSRNADGMPPLRSVSPGFQNQPGNYSEPEMSSLAIGEALAELERLIESEKKQRNQLDKKFDDLYGQPQAANSQGREVYPRGERPVVNQPLEQIAEDILDLVQRREALVDSDNIYNVLKRNPLQTVEQKNQIINQLMANQGSVPGKQRGSRKLANVGSGSTDN